MEARVDRKSLLLLLGLVLLIRLPFLNQAIQGDDHIYITEAQHALVDPLHPNDVKYVFLAVPAFVVNGGSLEADLPFLAFWMASIALFLSGRLMLAALAMAAAAMMAYQAVFLLPILFCGIRLRLVQWDRPPGLSAGATQRQAGRPVPLYATLLTPLLVLIAWQLFTRLTTGTMPAGKLAEYFSTYAFQAIQHKLQNALMLFIHIWWIVFPALVPATAALAWRKRRDPATLFLLAWMGIFFAGALAIFFSGSARYL